MVARELSDHISDQKEDYERRGMSEAEAETEAVRQMGDAVEVGMEMDRLHRPGMDKKTLFLVGILSLAALFLQTVVQEAVIISQGAHGNVFLTVLWQILFGVCIMVGILFLDYTAFAKKPVIVFTALVAVPVVMTVTENQLGMGFISFNVCRRIMVYLLLALFLPAFSGIIWHYRRKGWGGLLKTVLWLVLAMAVYITCMNRFSLVIFAGFSALLLLSYALAKEWYGIPRIPSLAALLGTTAGILALFLMKALQADYVLERLKAFFFVYSPDAGGSNYLTISMREAMGKLSLWGRGVSWDGKPVESSMSFFTLLNELGILPGILILLGLTALFLCMAAGVSKQKNVLGSLLGMACILSLAVPAAGHILCCLSLLPYTDVCIPFLYPGAISNLVCYTLLGLYLSVYRYKDVVA